MVSVRRVLKLLTWSLVALELVLLVGFVFSLWRYTSWYPRVSGAKITFDGVASSESALYLDIGRKCGGVLIRKTAAGDESYALGFGNCGNWRLK